MVRVQDSMLWVWVSVKDCRLGIKICELGAINSVSMNIPSFMSAKLFNWSFHGSEMTKDGRVGVV